MNAATYFNLAAQPARGTGSSNAPVVPQYLALAAGVVVEPFLHRYIADHALVFDWSSIWKQLVFGLVIAIIIFPAIYRNAFDPERPIFVQLCAIFASGIGWQSLFQAATGGSA